MLTTTPTQAPLTDAELDAAEEALTATYDKLNEPPRLWAIEPMDVRTYRHEMWQFFEKLVIPMQRLIDQARTKAGEPVAVGGSGDLSEKELALLNAMGGYQQVFDAIAQAVTRQESGLSISVMAFMRKVHHVPLAASPPPADQGVRAALEGLIQRWRKEASGSQGFLDGGGMNREMAREFRDRASNYNSCARHLEEALAALQPLPVPGVDREAVLEKIGRQLFDDANGGLPLNDPTKWLQGRMKQADAILSLIQGRAG